MEYEPSKDEYLPTHLDDSEITFNYCLGTDFKGGTLEFSGVRCHAHATDCN